jgi:hypothetical protein
MPMPQQPLPQQKKIKKAPNNFAVSKKHRTFARDLKNRLRLLGYASTENSFLHSACTKIAPAFISNHLRSIR